MATSSIGNNTLIPNTAITIHRVRNLFCRVASIFLSTFTFTIALSNEIDVSNNPSTPTINIVDNPHMSVPDPIYPTINPIIKHITVNTVDPKKYFLNVYITDTT